MRILYFAWIRERVGCGEEEMALPATVADVGGLIAHLKTLGPGHQKAFADLTAVRAAVNEHHVGLAHPVRDADEVAFFPPVTGG